MTDRMSNERIAELAEMQPGTTKTYRWLIQNDRETRQALRQTLTDLAQAEATIAERDAEIERLRRPEWFERTALIFKEFGPDVKETEHD